MGYTTAQLQEKTRVEIYKIAKAIADNKGITGISKYKKDRLVEFIMINQVVKIEEKLQDTAPAEAVAEDTDNIPTPQEFFDSVKDLDTTLEVHQACNELLDMLRDKYAVSTVSRKLTPYKALFYQYEHPNPKLNEPSKSDKLKGKFQHIAANLLVLDEEQMDSLTSAREESESSKRGINEDGTIRNFQLEPKEVDRITAKALQLLQSSDPVCVTCGVLVLTGLRKNEAVMPKIKYDSGILEREWEVVGEYAIAIKGLSKKGGFDGWFVRATLAPAQVIVEAQRKYLSSPRVQKISIEYNDFNNGSFRKAVDRKFKEIWQEELSTIEAYDDNGKRIGNNASTHKARAFYTWALIPVLKDNGFNITQAKKYVKECLGHESEKDTSKYFDRYNENLFVNATAVNIPLNFKEVGLVTSDKLKELKTKYQKALQLINEVKAKEIDTVEEVKEVEEVGEIEEIKQQDNLLQLVTEAIEENTPTEHPLGDLDLDKLTANLSPRLQLKFTEALNEGLDLTSSILRVIHCAENDPLKKVPVINQPRPDVGAQIKDIIVAAMDYNSSQPEIKNMVVPGYAFCNKVSKLWLGKEIAKPSFDKVWKEIGQDVTERLQSKDIDPKLHNGKYHRGTISNAVTKIVDLLNY